MRVGMPTLIEFDTFEENLKLCKELGLDFVEINMNLPQFNTELNIDEMITLLDQYQLEVTLHIAERIDICELDTIIRVGYLNHLKKCFEIAKALNVKIINMHMSEGIHFKLPTQKTFLYDRYETVYLEHIKTFKKFAEQHLGDIKLCLENTGILNCEFLQKGLDILLASDQIFLTYDIGHDITSGYKDQSYYQKHENAIIHYHIHDGTAVKNHLPLYTGTLDIDGFMKKIKTNACSCVIEVKSSEQLTESIKQLRGKNHL